jgi:uncharacterized protein with FMN-binding domain
MKSVKSYQDRVDSISFENYDASGIANGRYIGEYDVSLIYAKVEVIVENEKITNIKLLEHENGRGKAAEKIGDKIIDEQKIDVDAVSGATNSSQVIKKAVDNALSNGKQ